MKSIIRNKIDQEYKKGIKLREISGNEKISFDKSQKMRQEQQEHYKRYMFFRSLNNAIEKGKKNERN